MSVRPHMLTKFLAAVERELGGAESNCLSPVHVHHPWGWLWCHCKEQSGTPSLLTPVWHTDRCFASWIMSKHGKNLPTSGCTDVNLFYSVSYNMDKVGSSLRGDSYMYCMYISPCLIRLFNIWWLIAQCTPHRQAMWLRPWQAIRKPFR